ncbi:MAG: hypothetical protein B6D64_06945 [Bacteroidetes bacterium 4484_276]|nr:MAG: hypothetical protein B6D64_06945 [Bacteroidetes bacterium 4484_276]
MKFLITIIIFIFFYYLITKYVFPYLLNRFIRKAQEKFQQHQPGNNPIDQRKEGEVKVDYVPPESDKSEFNPDMAEDVDFEEVKEK